jgi:hypothetical protein
MVKKGMVQQDKDLCNRFANYLLKQKERFQKHLLHRFAELYVRSAFLVQNFREIIIPEI